MKRLATGTLTLALAAACTAAVAAQQQRPQAAAQDARPGLAILDFDIGATIGQDPDDYQALRRGGITGEKPCTTFALGSRIDSFR